MPNMDQIQIVGYDEIGLSPYDGIMFPLPDNIIEETQNPSPIPCATCVALGH